MQPDQPAGPPTHCPECGALLSRRDTPIRDLANPAERSVHVMLECLKCHRWRQPWRFTPLR